MGVGTSRISALKTAPICSRLLGLQLLERVNLDVLDKGEEFLARLLVLVALPRDSDTHLLGDVPDASGPDHAVELRVDADLLLDETRPQE